MLACVEQEKKKKRVEQAQGWRAGSDGADGDWGSGDGGLVRCRGARRFFGHVFL